MSQVTINGQELSEAEITVIRCALVSYALDLNDNILGFDDHGLAMKEIYKTAIHSITRKFGNETAPNAREFKQEIQGEWIPPEPDPDCSECHGDGFVHDADFSSGDSDQQMFLMQDTARNCPKCIESKKPKPG